ncbi:MAG TPA: MFS transporter [Chryseosolibacter sp.]|nr:MFS transporter [Chryseosolibacter sp.]
MKRNTFIVLLIFLIFFVISFLTNILGPLIPDIIESFDLSIGLAGFLPFSFFVAYGVMSIPSGILIEKYSEKTVTLAGFFLAFLAALLFALFPAFEVALISLFSIGIGMAMLQVVINPLLRTSGGEEHFAFNSVMAQVFFGSASFLSPLLYKYLVNNIHTENSRPLIRLFNGLVPPDIKWVSLYWVFSLTALLMVVMVMLVKFPKVQLKEDERIDTGTGFTSLLANRYVWLFFLAIFAYVGTEQGIANWTSKFLQEYHGVPPGESGDETATTGADVLSYFWGLMTIGCLLGLPMLKLFDSRKVLMGAALSAMLALGFALFGPVTVALICFPLTGFCISVMWSIVVSLGLNSVPRHHGTFSGILCTGIAGGAVVPLVIGGFAELVGLKFAMLVLFISLGYVLSVGVWAKPLVNNATVSNWREVFRFKFPQP